MRLGSKFRVTRKTVVPMCRTILPTKFHPNQIWYDKALGFFEEIHPTRRKATIKTTTRWVAVWDQFLIQTVVRLCSKWSHLWSWIAKTVIVASTYLSISQSIYISCFYRSTVALYTAVICGFWLISVVLSIHIFALLLFWCFFICFSCVFQYNCTLLLFIVGFVCVCWLHMLLPIACKHGCRPSV